MEKNLRLLRSHREKNKVVIRIVLEILQEFQKSLGFKVLRFL